MVSLLLFIGAMGKSAQLLLHTWLPDAMEGPTPVSALIHAATMVTAGVFLVCRMSPVLEWAPHALTFITFIGAATAFFAATVGLVQNDIKRVIAYSTCSQLGYMFVAAGVGAYPAAMFHLFTHASFKALLFLCAGSVIHAMHHEQDMRNYGGLRHKIPMTFWAMVIGTLAITGVGIPLTHIGFAGFLSKDAIIESAWAGDEPDRGLRLLDAGDRGAFTSFYSWRLIFLTFFGEARGDHHAHDHAHESPNTMLIPLGVLAAGAILAGMVWYGPFFGNHERMNAWFGIPAHEEAGSVAPEAENVAPQAAATTEAPASGEEHAAAPAAGEAAAPAEGMAAAEHVTGGPIGAIFFGPENHVIERAHEAPALVKVSPFIAMLGRVAGRLLVLHRQPGAAGGVRAAAAGALPLPAQQVVFRRDLRLPVRAAGEVARHASSGRAATGRRSTGRSTASPWGSSPGSPARRAGPSPGISSTTPSPWCWDWSS